MYLNQGNHSCIDQINVIGNLLQPVAKENLIVYRIIGIALVPVVCVNCGKVV